MTIGDGFGVIGVKNKIAFRSRFWEEYALKNNTICKNYIPFYCKRTFFKGPKLKL